MKFYQNRQRLVEDTMKTSGLTFSRAMAYTMLTALDDLSRKQYTADQQTALMQQVFHCFASTQNAYK